MSDTIFPADFVHLNPTTSIRILGDDGVQAGFVFLGDIRQAAPALASLPDVITTGLAVGDTLVWNGTDWVAAVAEIHSFDGGNF